MTIETIVEKRVQEFDKNYGILALELPEPVFHDSHERFQNWLRHALRSAIIEALEGVVPPEETRIGDQIAFSEGAFTPTKEEVAFEEGWNDARQSLLEKIGALKKV